MGGREFGLSRDHALGAGDGETNRLEAETGIACRCQRIELEVDETAHVRDVARRQSEPDIDGLDRTVDAIQ